MEFDDDEEEEPRWIFGMNSRRKEPTPFTNVRKDYICFERVGRKFVNILDGLELHSNVFSPPEQKQIVNFVYELINVFVPVVCQKSLFQSINLKIAISASVVSLS
ncbi:hypothetical protein HanRHA438_Chr06g0268361 [Helianthus annuus]|uniref:Uncharacterized protein n=1 Tax=Helianthus annuus TaxID=4232 RepID=A0A9K3IT41_HELAN|nr:hypothetical protein HanXRQr2_Chr06g0259301 [Helianthus annuus]KAJ0560551.1 putative RNA demethylase ALKBH9B/ALKBH10B [Helianthus annuus]KAJ0566919.1 hypothetical protein HanIR_Chr06g0278931 [Helianthus annuus]KAJ0573580.1 putative RNA demethylase ALKBH9B/ALKBH10B [Helianthus annuus]KAJ0737943.1 putative RNA demethylase ALKBH9B/ALKBH10B [Helianthus annuus]